MKYIENCLEEVIYMGKTFYLYSVIGYTFVEGIVSKISDVSLSVGQEQGPYALVKDMLGKGHILSIFNNSFLHITANFHKILDLNAQSLCCDADVFCKFNKGVIDIVDPIIQNIPKVIWYKDHYIHNNCFYHMSDVRGEWIIKVKRFIDNKVSTIPYLD